MSEPTRLVCPNGHGDTFRVHWSGYGHRGYDRIDSGYRRIGRRMPDGSAKPHFQCETCGARFRMGGDPFGPIPLAGDAKAA